MMLGRREFLLAAAAGAARQPDILFLFPDQLRHDFGEPPGAIPVRRRRCGGWRRRACASPMR
jgi:hypothetical protein